MKRLKAQAMLAGKTILGLWGCKRCCRRMGFLQSGDEVDANDVDCPEEYDSHEDTMRTTVKEMKKRKPERPDAGFHLFHIDSHESRMKLACLAGRRGRQALRTRNSSLGNLG